MKKSYITGIASANPPARFAQMQIAEFMEKALYLDATEARKLKALYRKTGIEYRHSVLEDYGKTGDFSFYPNQKGMLFPSTAQRMRLYEKEALPTALKATQILLNAKKDGLVAEITHLITVSCTGLYAPGLDIELIAALGLKKTVHRFGINFMGCYAAFNALKTADAICRADPGAKVLLVDVELCTLHFQQTLSEDDLLANAIFADGAAAVLVESRPDEQVKNLSNEGFFCDLAEAKSEDMAWLVRDFGFEMKLSSYVPGLLEQHIKTLTERLAAHFDLSTEQIDRYAIHPGGRRIVEAAERVLSLSPEKTSHSREVLRQYGNMSSVTVLFVLQAMLQDPGIEAGQHLMGMAFGPGLTLEAGLFGVC